MKRMLFNATQQEELRVAIVDAAVTVEKLTSMLRPSAAVSTTPLLSLPVSVATTPVALEIALTASTTSLRLSAVSVVVETDAVV